MSLFTRKDVDLPMVTQVLQIDLSDDQELMRFARRCLAIARIDHVRNAGIFINRPEYMEALSEILKNHDDAQAIALIESDGALDDWVTTPLSDLDNFLATHDAKDTKEYRFDEFKQTCQYAVELYETLAETNSVMLPMFYGLQRMNADERLVPANYNPEKHIIRHKGEMCLPLAAFTQANSARAILPFYFLAHEALKSLHDIWRQKYLLSHCAECRNLYLYRRAGSYCSDRCSQRARQRKYRNKTPLEIK